MFLFDLARFLKLIKSTIFYVKIIKFSILAV